MKGLDRAKTLPIVFAILGLILLSGGVSAYLGRGERTTCGACGMEIEKTDPSTFKIAMQDGAVRYGCCPICSLRAGIYYKNAVVSGRCFGCGIQIEVKIVNYDLSRISPTQDVSIVEGKACATTKIVCSVVCAQKVKDVYPWAKDLAVTRLEVAFQRLFLLPSHLEYSQIPYREAGISGLRHALIGIGLALLALSPVSWILPRRKVVARGQGMEA